MGAGLEGGPEGLTVIEVEVVFEVIGTIFVGLS